MSKNFLGFDLIKSDDLPFVVSSCDVSDLLLEGVIFSPNYDLLIYCINSIFLENELSISIKIEVTIQGSRKKHRSYNLSSVFSEKKFFTRFSGLFDEIEQEKFSVKVLFNIANASNLKIYKDQRTYSKQFNIIPLDEIKGERIYYDHKIIDIKSKKDIDNFIKNYNPREYKYYLSFNGTEEIIGPIRYEKLSESLISQYPTCIFPISTKIPLNSRNLVFFVEINDKGSEFFGIFPLSDIRKVFYSEYTNFTVNCKQFNPNINYPSGTVICGYRKKH